MIKVKLNAGERVGIGNLLNEISGAGGFDLSKLNKALNIISQTEIQPKEIKKLGMVRAGTSISWDPTKDYETEYELSDDKTLLLTEAIESKNQKKTFTMQDRYILSLAQKLGIKVD